MNCDQCRLSEECGRPLMGCGKKGAKIMFVQESPYEFEHKRGKYMIGKAGNLLRAALSEVGLDIDDCYFTSVVKCTTPDDRMPLPDECKSCIDYLWAEIDTIKPGIIVPTGNMSLKFLTGLTAITKQRGKLIEKDGYKFFPVIHPNLVLKQPKYMDMFSKDIINLECILSGNVPSDVLSFDKERVYCETFHDAMTEIDRLIHLPPGTDVVVDLETIKTNPFISRTSISSKMKLMYPNSDIPKIVAIGFSDRPGYGSAIPLFHRQSPFIAYHIGTIIKMLRMLFSRKDLNFAAHNGKFDMKWLLRQLNIWIADFEWDTMLMHYLCVTEEKGTHGLKDLAWLETNMGGYDDPLDDVKPKGIDEGNYDLIDWDILKVYLADDCDCTHRLLVKYKPLILENPDFNWIWYNLMKPGHYTMMNVECNGIKVDKEWLKILKDEYPKEIARQEERLHQYPEVLEIERECRARWEERIAIGRIQKRDRTDEQQEKFERYKKYDPKEDGDKFNFGSTAQLGELLFNRLGMKTVVLTDKGNPSTNDESLIYMKKQHPICDVILEFRKVRHLYDNFVANLEEMIDKDGVVHPNYNLHGTVTGRMSSDDPNAQQFPRKVNDPLLFQYWHEIKKLFVSRFGDEGIIMQFDYSQLELRILAVFSQDDKLIELYKSGADLHKAIASLAFGVPVEQITKDQRTASKKLQFGIVYQESPQGLSEDLRNEGITMSVEDCEQFIQNYFNRFPKVKKWVNNTKIFAKRHKFVKTLTGRIRHLPAIDSTEKSISSEAERQAVNAPIQSTGSDCTLQALIQINKWLKETNKSSKICITVHDSIVLDCPKSEVEEVAKKVKHIMEHLAEYNDYYKFLGDVPIVAEMEIGYSYGESFEVKDFDSCIDKIRSEGIDMVLKGYIDKKHADEEAVFKKALDEGRTIPQYVKGFWNKAS